MKLLDLLRRQGDVPASRLLWVTLAGGALAAGVVTAANKASAEGVELGRWGHGVLFLIVLAGMYVLRRRAAGLSVRAFERMIHDLRQDFGVRLRSAPLRAIEKLEDRLARVTGDLSFIAATLESWVSGVQHLVFVGCITVAISFISTRALGIWLVALGAMAWWMLPRRMRAAAALRELSADSARLGRQVAQLHDGFAQVKLDGRLAEQLAGEIEGSIDAVHARQSEVEAIALQAFIGSLTILFLLGSGVAAFASPTFIGLPPDQGYELVAFFELAMGPVVAILNAVPQIMRADASVASILDVLGALTPERASTTDVRPPRPFEALTLQGVEFAYDGADGAPGFVVGPIDLTIRRGELTMVTGGNGSGKTTLMKLLLGLYPPSRGQLRVDGRPTADLARWRARFTTILSQQHLFDRLHGLEDVAPARVDALLEKLGIADVVRFEDGGFSDLSLSAGQRMRLAMVVALLEDRPICVFDEWTANQDPETTRWYYDTLLPELLAAGKTLVVVSHDARFFDRASQLVRMARGAVVS